MGFDLLSMHRQIRMLQSPIQHRLLPIDHDIPNAWIDRALFIEGLEMTEKASGEIPVPRPQLQDRQA